MDLKETLLLKSMVSTVSAGFNEFCVNKSSRFKESVFDFKYFLNS